MTNNNPSPDRTSPVLTPITRRRFLAGAGASALSFTIMAPELVRGAEANSKVDIGLIGCGGRGQGLAPMFVNTGGYNMVAVADYFQDRTDSAGQKLGVPEAKRFTGLYGYRRLLDQKLDAVMIESPPFFHPEQAAAAVDAGKHVYCAKPIAVDVPGCTTIAEAGKKATEKKLVFLVDFQTRATSAFQEGVQRVRDGMIGPIKTAEAAYQCSLYFASMDAQFRQSDKGAAARLRAWAIDRVLSGDVITEQNIHSLDVATWFLDAAPIKAVGTGGRARDFLGDCWDHFSVIFTFPDDVVLTFHSKQFGAQYDDIMCRIYGVKGTAEGHYGGRVWVRNNEDQYDKNCNDGLAVNIANFRKFILESRFENPTVVPSVRSNLTTIVGRAACYQKREVTWDEVIKANEKLEFDTRGLKA